MKLQTWAWEGKQRVYSFSVVYCLRVWLSYEKRTRVCCPLSSHIWHQSRVLTWNCTLTWHGIQNAFLVSVTQVTRSFMWSHISQGLTSKFPFQSKPTNARQIHAHLMSTLLGHAHNYPQLSLSLFGADSFGQLTRPTQLARRLPNTPLSPVVWLTQTQVNHFPCVCLSVCASACVLRPINLMWFLQSDSFLEIPQVDASWVLICECVDCLRFLIKW